MSGKKRVSFSWLVPIALIGLSVSCLKLGDSYSGLPPGVWRGVLYLSAETDDFDERTGGELPFNFEVIYPKPDSFYIVIRNGEERIEVTDIKMAIDRRTGRDTIRIDFPVYDSHIEAQYEEDAIEGYWVVRNRKDYRVKFKALHGQDYRFFKLNDAPKADLSGNWLSRFGIEKEEPDTSIGEFKQNGALLTGTFLSPTGDDRFLEGVVSGDRMFLSVFDGAHAYLYEAKILDDGTLSGIYRSGNHYKTYWDASRNSEIKLQDLGDPMNLTQVVAPGRFTLTLPDTKGNLVDLHQPPFAGKPMIIQVMGTWCPNCRDETEFMLRYLQDHPDPGFNVVGISFEKHTDTTRALAAIDTYRNKMKIPYPILYGGSNNKDKASEVLSMLNRVVAFPTLIFLNADGQVTAVHTGFSGPATSGYEPFVNKFDELVAQMKEPS